ncbi:MAG: hypothetical protein IJJ41_06420 [Clostridia bacterium]|nr:hypothetical protein [Clostridia bacterium]
MKQLIEKYGKKKIIVCAIVAIVVIALAVTACIMLFGKHELKTIENKVDESYSQVVEKKDAAADDFDKALIDYEKSENGNEIVYTKGTETVKIKKDKAGKITYLSYTNNLPDDVQVKVKDFNESMIKIGDKEADVLKLLNKNEFVYQLKTKNEKEEDLHIYYYGWTGKEAALELVFHAGKLSYYAIHSDELAAKSDAPNVDNIV